MHHSNRSLACIALLSLGASGGLSAQCQPITYDGFHQNSAGNSIASQGGEALFGHWSGFSVGLLERRGYDQWWPVAHLSASGTRPGRMGHAVALLGDPAVASDGWDYSLPYASQSAPNGVVVVYERSAGIWSRVSELYPPIAVASLSFDDYTALLLASPALLTGGSGVLDANGRANLRWLVPRLPTYHAGVRFHHAVLALGPNLQLAVSNPITSELFLQ